MADQRNLFLAILLSAIVLFGWQYLVGVPQLEEERARLAEQAQQPQDGTAQPGPALPAPPLVALPRVDALAQSPRRVLATPTMDGSINLTGARFDDIGLRAYRETPDPESAEIELLSPFSAEHPYYAEFGWIAPQGSTFQLPGPQTEWTAAAGTLAPDRELTLSYDGGDGLVFTRQISVDDRYLFTIVDRVENRGPAAIVLYPYATIARTNLPEALATWIVHEGFIGAADSVLQDPSYDDIAEDNTTQRFESTGGWAGITDKYWMVAIIPEQQERLTGIFRAYDYNGGKAFESKYELAPRTIAPGATQEVTHRLFAGPKVVDIVEDYRDSLGVPLFDYSIDWGWFWFLTKPIFHALDYIVRYVGNFGIAILIFTVFVKLLFFPLASTSYRAMSKMKKLQPEMENLREKFKDDKLKQQQAMMELYRNEKVNPLSGCLPIVVQIPVFFSLYKVLFVSIEMRHAPFYGWIRDLSAPDPTSIFNLFGLLPFTPPGILMVGVFPILMGLTMWVQMSLNPPPADPVQARVFGMMPIIFTFMLAAFPVGLVIYWTWNNLLSVAQQMYIMRQSGVRIELFDRLLELGRFLKRGAAPKEPTRPPD